MEEKTKKVKPPISHETILKMMLGVTYVVASVYLLKNIIGKNVNGMLAIGGSLLLFTLALVIMRARKVAVDTQEFVISIGLSIVVFVISINSGAYYSDDFPMFLAVIGLTGLYLEPKFTFVQIILIDIQFALMYVIHPGNAESLGQYITCMAIFTLAAVLFYQTIRRGRAFISMSAERAVEAEKLLQSLTAVGEELQNNMEKSSARVNSMRAASGRIEASTNELRQGSVGIIHAVKEVEENCEQVHFKIQETEQQISDLNGGVQLFESALANTNTNMDKMNHQISFVKDTMEEANAVFCLLQKQMQEITTVTKQLNKISSNTTLLALNASIEAARAGEAGAGFAVVAGKVKELSIDSTGCSEQVSDVVQQMQEQVQKTTKQLAESTQALTDSMKMMTELQSDFKQLTNQFDVLYENIEAQNQNVTEVDSIFDELKDKVNEMSAYSEENHSVVDSIAEAMSIYRANVQQVLQDTKEVNDLSASMLKMSK